MKQKSAIVLTYFSGIASVAAVIFSIFRLTRGHSPWSWTFDHMEVIGFFGTLLFVAVNNFEVPFLKQGLPWEAAWWKFIAFGALACVIGSLSILAFLSVVVVLPVLIPFKMMRVHVLGPTATVASALLALPVVFFTTSLAFMMVYLLAMVRGKGNLVRNSKELYAGGKGEGWPLWETYYFSLSTMVKGTPQYEATGWCRWLALVEITVARLLEVAVVTIGIGTILKRSLGVAMHP